MNNARHRLLPSLVIPLVVSLLILVQCAGQAPPPGGPVDTVPPAIIRTVPDTNAVRITDNTIELEFSEYVDRRSVEESIFISPPVGGLEFDWSGREVAITFHDTLRRNTTYVVNLGTDIIDKQAGVRMVEGFSLAFSTGDSIDRGAIAGKVVDEKPEGVMIFAYLLNDIDPDTLNPAKRRPDYVMQTGKDGKFVISNLAMGSYRLLAVRDEYRNLLYDVQADQYGVLSRGILLTPATLRVSNAWFLMAREDTTRPFVSNVQPLNRSHVRVRFNEPIDSVSFISGNFFLTDTLTSVPVGISLRFQIPSARDAVDIITTAPLDSSATYRLSVEGLSDTAGQTIDPLNASLVFAGLGTVDTIRPGLRIPAFADTTFGYPLHRPLEIMFSEPVDTALAVKGIRIIDAQEQDVATDLGWLSPIRLLARPKKVFPANTFYEIRVAMDSVRDFSGNAYADSLLVLKFRTFDLKKAGEIEGLAKDGDDSGKGPLYVTATGVGFSWQERIRLGAPGSFRFGNLPEGRYLLSLFRDADSSGRYSSGLPFPFQFSERFLMGSDTIKVRARWGVEGVSLTLP